MKRINQKSNRNDVIKDVNIGIYDHDSVIKYYFDNVIKPKVTYKNNESVAVPLKYANSERWKSIRKSGYIRDKKGQIQLPVIVYKRTTVSKNDDLPNNKMNPLNPKLFYVRKGKYSKSNRYSNYTKLYGQLPSLSFHKIVIPDYVILSYDFIVWTDYLEQMNKIIETINYHEGSYWGNEKFKFITRIDDYAISTENDSDKDRFVRCNFTLTLKGYLIPDIYNKTKLNKISYSNKKIIIEEK